MSGYGEFENLEAFYQALWFREREAMANLAPQQDIVGWGKHWMLPNAELEVIIFGYCFTLAEVRDQEIRCGADAEELEFTLKNIQQAHERGYRYSNNYSVLCPEGEIGSNHVSRMWPISRGQMAQAQEAQWEPSLILAEGGEWLRDKLVAMAATFSRKEQPDG